MERIILGISAFYHDSAAALVVDGEIVAAAQEERFSRKKHDPQFPKQAVQYVLDEAGVGMDEVSQVIFYEKPLLKFERLLETYHAFAPRGLPGFLKAMPVWMKEKLFLRQKLKKELGNIGPLAAPLLFCEHHLSHAASAFFPSPFSRAAILCLDGVGEWATTTIGLGEKNKIEIKKELRFPHSIGLLYSACTSYGGFRVNGGEYKLMGLAPFANAQDEQVEVLKSKIRENIVDIREDGSILLNMDYFKFATGRRMTHPSRWQKLLGFPPRQPEGSLTQDYANLALAIQQITEEIILKLAKTAREITGANHLVMAGGVALNCVANGKLLRSNIFKDIWFQPAAGDAGGALGAALALEYLYNEKKRVVTEKDEMRGTYLGPSYSDQNIHKSLRKHNLDYEKVTYEKLYELIAEEIAMGKIVGWFQGRMEFGPRALGNRSILADPRDPDMQKKLNLNIKFREAFRPFAPVVLEERASEYFEVNRPAPYMMTTALVKEEHRLPVSYQGDIYADVYQTRSSIPAVTHLDYSARLQTVSERSNRHLYRLITYFYQKTGVPLLVNTSFNRRGEPVVCHPEDAIQCFLQTEMDVLVLGNYVCGSYNDNSIKKPVFTNSTDKLFINEPKEP